MIEYIVDTSALLTYLQDEEGKDRVKELLITSKKINNVGISFVSLTELYYLLKPHHAGKGLYAFSMIRQLPLQVIWADMQLTELAGEIKSDNKLSFADAWIAASAITHEAILLHKDPEYEAIKHLRQEVLPYKKR